MKRRLMMTGVIDSHQHFWDPERADYPWMTGERAALRRRLQPEQLAPQVAAAGVRGTIVVQARQDAAEMTELLAIAERTAFVRGAVAWADLTDPGLGDTLARAQSRPAGRWLVGIRHQVEDELDPAWLARPAVRRGVETVGRHGLVYDLLVKPPQLASAVALVEALPEVSFVLDHAAKPRLGGPFDHEWAAGAEALAAGPNVACKLSGLVSELPPGPLRAELVAPYLERCLRWFGPDRVLFGSDWPVCTLRASYREVVAFLDEAIQLAGGVVDEPLLGGNAERIYGLTGDTVR